MAGVLGSIVDYLRGRKQGKPPTVPGGLVVGEGHRGIAAGDLKERHRLAVILLRSGDPAHQPYDQTDIDKWQRIPAGEVRDFLEGELLVVHSSNLAAVQFHPSEKSAMFEFHNGHAYLVSPITPEEALSFATSQSKGGWYWDNVRIRGTRDGHKKSVRRLR